MADKLKTEIVYVLGADYWRYLFLSLRTLLVSGTQFERVVVYVVGDKKPRWNFKDPRINIKLVPDIGNGYWYINKTHICDSNADRLIFLDTDTMVLKPLELVYNNISADLIARNAPGTYLSTWRQERWEEVLNSVGAPSYPFYSCGFMIFQNGAHRKMKETWPKLTEEILQGKLPIKKTRFAEQQAFSLSAAVEGLSHSSMKNNHHVYAMNGESPNDAVVYHLGTPNFYTYYRPVELERGLHRMKLSVKRPSLMGLHKLVTRGRLKISKTFYGHRDIAGANKKI